MYGARLFNKKNRVFTICRIYKEMGDEEKIFMLPMLKARNDERESVTKLIASILDKFELQKCDPDKICECILENCIDS